MKRKLLILLGVVLIVGLSGVVYLNYKSKQLEARNAPTGGPPTPTLTNAPALPAAPVPAAENIAEFKGKPGSKVRIDGTSSIHDWYAEGKIISGLFQIDKTALSQPKPGPVYATAKVLIPVKSLRSSSGPPMDTVMYGPKGFNVDLGSEYGRINYNLEALVIKKSPANASDPIECDSRGELVIHATTNKIDMPVTIEKGEADELLVKGKLKMRMSSFGIDPPKITIVAEIVTGDDVDVLIEWKLMPVAK